MVPLKGFISGFATGALTLLLAGGIAIYLSPSETEDAQRATGADALHFGDFFDYRTDSMGRGEAVSYTVTSVRLRDTQRGAEVPLGDQVGELARVGGPLDVAAARHGATSSQLALVWLLRRSPVMLSIPGTSKTAHVEENTEAARIRLTDAEFGALSALPGSA